MDSGQPTVAPRVRKTSGRRWLDTLAAGLVGLALTVGLTADDEEKSSLKPDEMKLAQRFASVAAWEGYFTTEISGARSGDSGQSKWSYTSDAATSGTFRLEPSRTEWHPKYGDFVWQGRGQARGYFRHQDWERDREGLGFDEQTEVSSSPAMNDVHLTVWIGSQFASLHSGYTPEADRVPARTTGRAIGKVNLSNGRYERRTTTIDRTSPWDPITWADITPGGAWSYFQGGPRPVVITREYDGGGYTWSRAPQVTRTRVVIYPVFDDVEVEVTAAGYEQWRPLGQIADPKKPGAGIALRATLRRKAGSPEADQPLPPVKRFRFELAETSREPGICLNWPLEAKDTDFDLKLTSTPAFPASQPFVNGATVSVDGQKAEWQRPPQDEAGRPFADVAVESYDFGGRAELMVICELEDGRELIGKLSSAGEPAAAIRLPLRRAGDWVAEAWRTARGVAPLSAADDEEKVDGQPLHGDGYTLYEEYRGWVVNGKHVEGDPKRKDFFVFNFIGAPARPGIALFERVSQIRVHHRMTNGEFPLSRVMNHNRSKGPHRVDQHGVVMFSGSGTGTSGGRTHAVKGVSTGRAWRPKDIQNILLELPDLADGIFSTKYNVQRYNLNNLSGRAAYARGVAHELLHAVGVEHHGEGLDAREFYFEAASDPNNPVRRPRFVQYYWPANETNLRVPAGAQPRSLDRGPTKTLLWEDTGASLAEETAAAFEAALAAERKVRSEKPPGAGDPGEFAVRFPQYRRSAEYWRESALHNAVAWGTTEAGYQQWAKGGDFPSFMRHITIGELGRTDSGNEDCIMRYYFANAYPVNGLSDTYWLVRPGKNHIGNQLCRDAKGTGGNDADHKPQPRFGDATVGNCLAQVCPNDAHPPR